MVATARKQPLYDQLVDILADKIEHEYHAGDMISSERELSERYGLSRTTVRLALQELERLGLIVRQHGVAHSWPIAPPRPLTSCSLTVLPSRCASWAAIR